MPRPAETMLGQPIQVPEGLKATCRRCEFQGDNRSRLVTDGTEIADVREETYFNGKFHAHTGRASVWLECPNCGALVQFAIPNIRI